MVNTVVPTLNVCKTIHFIQSVSCLWYTRVNIRHRFYQFQYLRLLCRPQQSLQRPPPSLHLDNESPKLVYNRSLWNIKIKTIYLFRISGVDIVSLTNCYTISRKVLNNSLIYSTIRKNSVCFSFPMFLSNPPQQHRQWKYHHYRSTHKRIRV